MFSKEAESGKLISEPSFQQLCHAWQERNRNETLDQLENGFAMEKYGAARCLDPEPRACRACLGNSPKKMTR